MIILSLVMDVTDFRCVMELSLLASRTYLVPLAVDSLLLGTRRSLNGRTELTWLWRTVPDELCVCCFIVSVLSLG